MSDTPFVSICVSCNHKPCCRWSSFSLCSCSSTTCWCLLQTWPIGRDRYCRRDWHIVVPVLWWRLCMFGDATCVYAMQDLVSKRHSLASSHDIKSPCCITNFKRWHQSLSRIAFHQAQKLVILSNTPCDTKWHLPIHHLDGLLVEFMLATDSLDQVNGERRWIPMIASSNTANDICKWCVRACLQYTTYTTYVGYAPTNLFQKNVLCYTCGSCWSNHPTTRLERIALDDRNSCCRSQPAWPWLRFQDTPTSAICHVVWASCHCQCTFQWANPAMTTIPFPTYANRHDVLSRSMASFFNEALYTVVSRLQLWHWIPTLGSKRHSVYSTLHEDQ